MTSITFAILAVAYAVMYGSNEGVAKMLYLLVFSISSLIALLLMALS
jgi:hypothetical protein